MVREDNCLLETHRLVANSSGIVDLVRTDNWDACRHFLDFAAYDQPQAKRLRRLPGGDGNVRYPVCLEPALQRKQ